MSISRVALRSRCFQYCFHRFKVHRRTVKMYRAFSGVAGRSPCGPYPGAGPGLGFQLLGFRVLAGPAHSPRSSPNGLRVASRSLTVCTHSVHQCACTRRNSPHPPPWPGHSFVSLFAQGVPVYPYTLAASFCVAWPGRSLRECLRTVYQSARTQTPHPPPRPGHSFPECLRTVYRRVYVPVHTRRILLPGLTNEGIEGWRIRPRPHHLSMALEMPSSNWRDHTDQAILQPAARGSHSLTLQLNLSAFRVTGGAVRDCFGGVQGVVGGMRGV